MSEKENNPSLSKLITRVNSLLNEISILKSEARELKKTRDIALSFLKEIPQKNPLHKKATNIIEEID
jgi:cell shape-determining protein MreC